MFIRANVFWVKSINFMYMYMYMYTHVCIGICAYVYMYGCMYICMAYILYIGICVHKYKCKYVHIYYKCKYINTYSVFLNFCYNYQLVLLNTSFIVISFVQWIDLPILWEGFPNYLKFSVILSLKLKFFKTHKK